MKKLLIVQPLIAQYRVELFNELSNNYELMVIYSKNMQKSFGDFEKNLNKNIILVNVDTSFIFSKMYYQHGIIHNILSFKPNSIIIFANLRYISFWNILIISKILKINIYPHGHGLFKKNKPSFIYKILYKFIFSLSTKYICYNNSVKNIFINLGFESTNLAVAQNSLMNKFIVKPNEKKYNKLKFLFLGRLRKETELEMLIQIIIQFNYNKNIEIELEIIGDGEESELVSKYSKTYSFIKWHGAIYDQKQISTIAKECLALIYLGNIGLSVVHAFSMSLPVITHDVLYMHGPEASYITKENGYLLDQTKLRSSLELFFNNVDKIDFMTLSTKSYQTYLNLIEKSLATQIFNILENIE